MIMILILIITIIITIILNIFIIISIVYVNGFNWSVIVKKPVISLQNKNLWTLQWLLKDVVVEAIAPKERTWEGGSTSPKQDVHACQGGENVQSIADAKGSVEGTSAMIEMVRFLQEIKEKGERGSNTYCRSTDGIPPLRNLPS